MTTNEIIDSILAAKLHSPVAGYDVDAEMVQDFLNDFGSYIDILKEPAEAVEAFQSWMDCELIEN